MSPWHIYTLLIAGLIGAIIRNIQLLLRCGKLRRENEQLRNAAQLNREPARKPTRYPRLTKYLERL